MQTKNQSNCVKDKWDRQSWKTKTLR